MTVSPAIEQTDQNDEDIPVELRLDLPSFEGPMDLLLQLVRGHEIDIFEIPIALITEEYLACIERMEDLDLEVGGDWLEMAARLMYIKSRTLVPDDDEGDDEEEGPDPHEELVRQLIEYERYKKFSEKLEKRPKLDEKTFTSPGRLERFRHQAGPPEVRNSDVSLLLDAVARIIDTADDGEEFVYEMTREKISLRSVILDIASRLENSTRITFASLFEGRAVSKNRIVTTFVALLEMTRVNMITLFQTRMGHIEDLYLERAVSDIVEIGETLDLPDSEEPDESTSTASPRP